MKEEPEIGVSEQCNNKTALIIEIQTTGIAVKVSVLLPQEA